MKEWMPIKRTDIKTHGINRKHPGLLDVCIHLSRSPPPGWPELFNRPIGVSISSSMHYPNLQGDKVWIRPPDNEIERYVRHVDERIESANINYQNQVLPRVMAESQRKGEEEAKLAQRLEEARKKTKGL